MTPGGGEIIGRVRLSCGLANSNSVTLDLWPLVNNRNAGQRWGRQLTNMRHGLCVAETSQNRCRVKVFKPKQTAVCGVGKIIMAHALVGLSVFTHVQNRFPSGGHKGLLGVYDCKNVLPKPLNHFQGLIVV